jgi:hypothetical protein
VIVDDLGKGTASKKWLHRILSDAAHDPVGAILRHFDTAAAELFALIGPPGVIAGSGPLVPGGAPLAVWVEPDEGVLALGFAENVEWREEGWLALPAGIAVCWRPTGPEAYCDLLRGTTGLWMPER